jgi:hypothetical protein
VFDMRDERTTELAMAPVASASPQRIRWGAVFAGTVLGLALLALLTTLWLALGFNSGVDDIRANIEWYIGGTAVACLFLGALLAGWLSGVRGAGSGFVNGITMWGLIFLVSLAVGLPSIFNVFNLGRVSSVAEGTTLLDTSVDGALWASFWTILGGFVAAGLGGLIGGAVAKPANTQVRPMASIDRDRTDRPVVIVEDDREHEGHEHGRSHDHGDREVHAS